MHIIRNKSPYKGAKKIYQSVLLRESYRENGKVKKRTIANLSNCKPGEIAAIELALKHKDDLSVLGSLKEKVEFQEGLSMGAVWTVYQIAKDLGIEKALGHSFTGKLALWQVVARVIDQGSRLSAVRLAQTHETASVLDIRRGFDENDLYDNLKWLSENQGRIEDSLFLKRRNKSKPELFLYDVTGSYLEGQENFFGAYGYTRDGKKGKKQIVIGLLCDEEGEPISIEVFPGNTQDPQTFASQVDKVARRFGCKRVTIVGDRGMIKSAQIKQLPSSFHYITAITKAQINSLIEKGVIQLGLFDEEICEIKNKGWRYILRRNPLRADEIALNRQSKQDSIKKLVEKKNKYLIEHPGASASVALREVTKRMEKLKVDKWLSGKSQGQTLFLEVDKEALKKVALLDGCYVIKTDLPKEAAETQIIHDRYQDLIEVEQGFRICKTEHLEMRPVHVRTAHSTRGHAFVVMLAYMIVRKLRRAWVEFDLTVKEGLDQLSTLCSMEMKVKGQGTCLKIPRPRKNSQQLLKALDIRLPLALPHREIRVVTRKKLFSRRKLR